MSLGKESNNKKDRNKATSREDHPRSKFAQKINFFQRQHIIVAISIPILALLITIICFSGQDLYWAQFVPNIKSKVQVKAEVSFEYVSRIKTKQQQKQRRNLVAPVYTIDDEIYRTFEKKIHKLDELLDEFSTQYYEKIENIDIPKLKSFARKFSEENDIIVSWSDINVLLQNTDEYERTGVLVEGLLILKNILKRGVFDPNAHDLENNKNFSIFEIQNSDQRHQRHKKNEAIRSLQLSLSSTDTSVDISRALSRILGEGIKNNIVYDAAATSAKILKKQQETPNVIEKVNKFDLLLNTGSIITSEHYERLLAYRETLKNEHVSLPYINGNFTERFLTLCSMLSLAYFILLMMRRIVQKLLRREMILAFVLFFLNLLICRLAIKGFNLGKLLELLTLIFPKDFFNVENFIFDPLYFLPNIMPITFSCLLGTLLIRTYVGALLGTLVVLLCCLMLSQSVEFLVISLVVIFISIHRTRHAHSRKQIIDSGILSDTILTLWLVVYSISSEIPAKVCLIQVLLGFLNCTFTAMFVLMILPFFENRFKCYSNIGLIELMNCRQPLLMKLQTLAPGTYYHSSVVANLCEQVAIDMHANPFLCRAQALYHDIGKLTNPEYFSENQGNENLHDEKTPFMSALIIKSHIKEGLTIAKAAGLPPRIIDGIIEHHGTTTIRYFYAKALKQQEDIESPAGSLIPDQDEVKQSIFKYDGPKPQSKETLILSIADSIEAASRSLTDLTPQSIRALVNDIIDVKIQEEQFEACDITFGDVKTLRQSFHSSLLSMMHSRISYAEAIKRFHSH